MVKHNLLLLDKLKIKIFADSGDINKIIEYNSYKTIKGFTTNPSLLKKNGINDYKRFAKKILKKVNKKPISFEIVADNFKNMEKQARIISSWGDNVFVKIPVTNTKKKFTGELIKKLSDDGIKLNITALFTLKQIREVLKCLNYKTPNYISIFAGRIADTGTDPKPIIRQAKKIINKKNCKIIWASTREIYNIFEAESCGCNIITVTNEFLDKIKSTLGKNLENFSLDTVKMFYNDAKKSNLKI